MDFRRRVLPLLAAIAVAVPLVSAGCTSGPIDHAGRSAPAPPKLAVTPALNSKNVPISTEIGLSVTDGKVTEVALTDDKGGRIDGAFRTDGSTWIPGQPLKHKQAYTAQVTAANDKGKTVTQTTSFTTMDKPAKQTGTSLYLENDRTYGAAMPVTVGFDADVPKEARAEVQRRLFVSTEPSQPGVWHWSANGREVSYRAPDFWQPGTKIAVRTALAGLPMGGGRYGDADHTTTAKVGEKVTLEIDNGTKQMSVFKNDNLLRKIPVSLGKSSTPTSSGKMVIMEKFASTVFDTRGAPDGGYVVTVANAQRLTWGGEFIHAAPWSVGDQGYTNVSHGCTNLSDEAAAWLMGVTQVGDLVTIKGTEVKLEPGNGWTVWDMSWDEFIKGSALPVPADLKPAPEPAQSGGGTPSSTTSTPASAPSNNGGR